MTHFVTQRLRMSQAYSSIESYLRDIKHLKLWESIYGRDLLDEIYNGRIPNRTDIDSIKEHCAYQVKAFKTVNRSKVIDMGDFSMPKTLDKPTVQTEQYLNRIAHISEFLLFIGQERVKHKPNAAQLFDELEKMKSLFKRKPTKARLRRKKASLDKSGLSDEVFEDFVEVAKPSSEHNPFTEDMKLRNYAMVQTLYETGLRRSELLALQIGDIGTDIMQPELLVRRRQDNKVDPRLREPTAKTEGRGISISKGLRDLLFTYIKEYRSRTTNAKKHPFIFVSHKSKEGSYETGMPLAKDSLNKLFNKIKAVNPERFKFISPHLYRHYFNDRISMVIEDERERVKDEVKRLESDSRHEEAKQYAVENTITEQRELEIRAELNGHASLDSGRHYLRRTARRNADEIRNKMHVALKHKVESFKDAKSVKGS